jgi:hypothetical protein
MGTVAAVLLGATLATAQAPDTNNMTMVTFSAPVSLPGVTLPAGSYMFKLADSQVNRNIVQVFDKDRTKIFATILAIPAERNEPADETVITFAESPANAAPAIRYWYYPGEKRGQEFAYPKKQAQDIANAAHTSVLSIDTDDSSADGMTKGQLSRAEPSANANESMAQNNAQSSTQSMTAQQPNANQAAPAQAEQPQATQPQPTTTPQAATEQPTTSSTQQPTTEQPSATPSAQSTSPSPSTPSASTRSTSTPSASTPSDTQGAVGTSGTRRANLPKTASTLPLIGFAGLLALASAFGVRAIRRVYA